MCRFWRRSCPKQGRTQEFLGIDIAELAGVNLSVKPPTTQAGSLIVLEYISASDGDILDKDTVVIDGSESWRGWDRAEHGRGRYLARGGEPAQRTRGRYAPPRQRRELCAQRTTLLTLASNPAQSSVSALSISGWSPSSCPLDDSFSRTRSCCAESRSRNSGRRSKVHAASPVHSDMSPMKIVQFRSVA